MSSAGPASDTGCVPASYQGQETAGVCQLKASPRGMQHGCDRRGGARPVPFSSAPVHTAPREGKWGEGGGVVEGALAGGAEGPWTACLCLPRGQGPSGGSARVVSGGRAPGSPACEWPAGGWQGSPCPPKAGGEQSWGMWPRACSSTLTLGPLPVSCAALGRSCPLSLPQFPNL